jgi:hypothetical protein
MSDTADIRKDDILTLEYPGIAEVQARHSSANPDTWHISLNDPNIDKLPLREYISVSYVSGDLLHLGLTKIIHVDLASQQAIISVPEITDSRPARLQERIATHLPTAIIVMEDLGDKTFKFRKENMILNVSLGGVLIATKQPLEDIHNILLLTSLDENSAHREETQVYFPATIVRQAQADFANLSQHPELKHFYGVQFRAVFPQFKGMLKHFIDLHGVDLRDDPLDK